MLSMCYVIMVLALDFNILIHVVLGVPPKQQQSLSQNYKRQKFCGHP